MSYEPRIPVAFEPDLYIRGRLVSPELANQVQFGWKIGVVYVLLKLAVWAFLWKEDLPYFIPEILVVSGLVYGVYRWKSLAAWLLFGYLLVSAVMGAFDAPTIPGFDMPLLFIPSLVFFGVVFGRAAIAIRKFNRGNEDTTQT